MSRQQLIAETGMSRGTLYERLDTLARLGLIYDAETLGTTGGRPARRVRFEDRGRVALAVDFGHTHARVSVTDLDGTELRSVTCALRITDPIETVLVPTLDTAGGLLAQGSGEQMVGVGVGMPATVDPASGHVLHPSTIPGWPPDAIVAAVAQRWGVPLVVENDARAGAVGECRTRDETLVYVKLSTGLGCGIVVDGDVLRGAGGIAGDIGHVRMTAADQPGAPRCRCGRIGCLAAYSSGRALLERLAPRGIGSLAALVAAAQDGDPHVLDALRAAGDVLGTALATTVTTVNPHRLVLGGALGGLPTVVERVRAQVRDTVVERAWPVVEGSALGARAPVTGLSRLVVRRVFAPAAVDAAVAAASA
jgi:predicted NBD/HSP70 family sugar kinase